MVAVALFNEREGGEGGEREFIDINMNVIHNKTGLFCFNYCILIMVSKEHEGSHFGV